MQLRPFTFHSPKTVKEAVQLINQWDDARLLSGGTILINQLKALKKSGGKTPRHIISLKKIKELQGITVKQSVVYIRPYTTLHEIMESSLLTDNLEILKHVASQIATTPIRNMATLGGNLMSSSTITEMPAVMIALDATLHFHAINKKEYRLSADDFYGNKQKRFDLLTNIELKKDKNSFLAYRRATKTSALDVPMLCVCIKSEKRQNKFSNVRAVINNRISFAQRDACLEKYLNNQDIKININEAIKHLDEKIIQTKNTYKKHMFGICAQEALEDLQKKLQENNE